MAIRRANGRLRLPKGALRRVSRNARLPSTSDGGPWTEGNICRITAESGVDNFQQRPEGGTPLLCRVAQKEERMKKEKGEATKGGKRTHCRANKRLPLSSGRDGRGTRRYLSLPLHGSERPQQLEDYLISEAAPPEIEDPIGDSEEYEAGLGTLPTAGLANRAYAPSLKRSCRGSLAVALECGASPDLLTASLQDFEYD
jgi:hypothetical protein